MKEARNYEEIKDYLRCPMLFYWKHVVISNEEPPRSSLSLPGQALRQAMPIYYDGENHKYELVQWVDFVWTTWLKQAGLGQDDVIKGFQAYHRVRYHEGLKPFLTGESRGPGGKKYVEPRASKAYKDRVRLLNLPGMEEELSNATFSAMKIEEAEIVHLNLGRYSIAQAYSDSLIMAMNFKAPKAKSVWGAGRPVRVRLDDRVSLAAIADLVTVVGGKSQVYYLDARPMFFVENSMVWKRPDVIAAGLIEAEEGDDPFPPIEMVHYVHLFTGEVMSRKVTNASRLQNILIMASRGISANIFIPAFLSEDDAKCRACELRSRCYDREDILESAFPGSYQTAGALEAAVRNTEARELALKLAAKLTEFDLMAVNTNPQGNRDDAVA